MNGIKVFVLGSFLHPSHDKDRFYQSTSMAELIKIQICNKIILNRTNIKVQNCTTDTDKMACETSHERAVDWAVSPKSLPNAYVKEKRQICCAVITKTRPCNIQ